MPGEISPEDVEEKQRNGDDLQIVDIRDADAFADGHIPGATNLPLAEFDDRVKEVEWADDETEEIVVACYIGESSVQAARLLDAYDGTGDATVTTMAGGYDEYEGDLEAEA